MSIITSKERASVVVHLDQDGNAPKGFGFSNFKSNPVPSEFFVSETGGAVICLLEVLLAEGVYLVHTSIDGVIYKDVIFYTNTSSGQAILHARQLLKEYAERGVTVLTEATAEVGKEVLVKCDFKSKDIYKDAGGKWDAARSMWLVVLTEKCVANIKKHGYKCYTLEAPAPVAAVPTPAIKKPRAPRKSVDQRLAKAAEKATKSKARKAKAAAKKQAAKDRSIAYAKRCLKSAEQKLAKARKVSTKLEYARKVAKYISKLQLLGISI